MFGQGVTTASLTGFVTDASGTPIVGATVTAVHVPSGTKAMALTRSTGQYTIDGLRPGGPYSITITGKNVAGETRPDVYVDVGEQGTQNFKIGAEVVTLAAVSVSESRDTTFDSGAMGTATRFNAASISAISSTRGDLSDIINLDPRAVVAQAGTTDPEYTYSIGGQNPRANLILIDGVSGTDNFGLNSNGYAGARNPVPFPWMESAAILINEYDLVYSGYTGGVIDLTLKSGTNEFHGALYTEYEGTNFRGSDPSPGILGAHEPMQIHTTGAALGGPIIKDKLFFFVGYEAFRELSEPTGQAFNPYDTTADQTVINSIFTKAQSLGYQVGSFSPITHYWEQNFVGKIDWNINDSQNFDFTFRHTAGNLPVLYQYTGTTETSTSTSFYNSYRTDQSYTAKLNSDWSSFIPGLHSEIEATYKRYNGTATYDGPDLPAVTVESLTGAQTTTAGTAEISTGKIFLGRYYAYQLNNVYTWEQEEHAYGEYSIGDHTFKFGVSFDRTGYTDTFIPNYLGSYYFANTADFLAATPTYVNLETSQAGYTLGSDVSHYYYMDIAPLIQDTWKPMPSLTILGGVRLDDPYQPQNPPFSPLFYNTLGYRNNTTMNGNYTISPRLSFNYSLPTKEKTQIRGGAGLFLGASPVVWLENSYNNAGQLNNYTTGSTSATAAPIASTYTLNPSNQALPPVAPGTAVPSFDTTASNFKQPANWKENIAIDRQLPFGLIATAEADFSQVEKDIAYKLGNIAVATSGPTYTPDGAIRYGGNITANQSGDTLTTSPSIVTPYATTKVGQVYELVNTDKGGSQEYTLELSRPMKDNWAFMLAYTHTHATAVDWLTSSVASSNFIDQYFVNPNDDKAYRSQFSVPDKFLATLTYQFHFFPAKYTATTVSAQFIAQTGQAFSYTFYGDADGSGGSAQSLFYVPTGPSDPKVAWSSTTEEANFFSYLNGHPELEKYAGQIAPRNAFYAPWQHTVNLHFEQQLPAYGSAHFTVFADCFNFANLLNKTWGIVSNYNSGFGEVTVAGADYLPAANGGQGQYVYRFNSTTLSTSAPTIYSDESRWAMQVGVRLEF